MSLRDFRQCAVRFIVFARWRNCGQGTGVSINLIPRLVALTKHCELVLCALALCALVCAPPAQAQRLDAAPRTVVMTAFGPEYDALVGAVADPHDYTINGARFVTGTLEGKPVLLMKSGVSVVNAAMTTQLVLDRFAVRRIVFSGIAGGVDPALQIGDVVVPSDWGQYLEASFARATPRGWQPPEHIDGAPANWQFVFPRGTKVLRADGSERRMFTIPADPALVDLARKVVPGISLSACVDVSGRSQCLPRAPHIEVGGPGVTAGIFADNAEFREYLFSACPRARYGKRQRDPGRLCQWRSGDRVPQPVGSGWRRCRCQSHGHVRTTRLGQFGARGARFSCRFARLILP